MRTLLLSLAFLVISCGGPLAGPPGGGPGPGIDPGGDPGPGGTVAPTNKGGTRLKARVISGADGSKAYPGMFDSQLGANCVYVQSEDGKLRCLPLEGAATDSGYFVDPSCSESAFVADKGCSPKFGYKITGGAACSGYFYKIMAVTAYSPTTIYMKNGNNCVSSAPSNGSSYFRSSAMAASSFVEGSESFE